MNPVIKTYKILVHKACLYVHDKLLLHGMFYLSWSGAHLCIHWLACSIGSDGAKETCDCYLLTSSYGCQLITSPCVYVVLARIVRSTIHRFYYLVYWIKALVKEAIICNYFIKTNIKENTTFCIFYSLIVYIWQILSSKGVHTYLPKYLIDVNRSTIALSHFQEHAIDAYPYMRTWRWVHPLWV